MARDLAMVFGFWGLMSKLCRSQASTMGEQPSAWAPLLLLPPHHPQPALLLHPFVYLCVERAAGQRNDAVIRGLPAELLAHLEGQRLAALRVVGPHIDVDERPRVLVGQLAAHP